MLAALAAHQPVTLFLDDLQWADASTLGLLAYLTRQGGQSAPPLTYLATTRPIPPRSPVATLVQGMTREARILRLRFGLENGRAYTLEEVGQKFGLTRERIRQIESKALRRLRHPRRARQLKDYL